MFSWFGAVLLQKPHPIVDAPSRHGVKPYPAFLKSIRSLFSPGSTDYPQTKPPPPAPMESPQIMPTENP
jgi:hypothetical protein